MDWYLILWILNEIAQPIAITLASITLIIGLIGLWRKN